MENSLIRFIDETTYDSLPPEVVSEAKKRILDFLGVALAGSKELESKIVAQLLIGLNGKGESVVIGYNNKVPSPNAALINGVSGHTLELDDVNTSAIIHPAVTVIPATLAMGERIGAKGEDLITSVVVGYDIGIRIAKATNPSHRFKGFHTTGTCGSFGAAAAAGKILGLSEEKMANTIGLAATQAAGLLESRAMSKRLNPGKAAYNGIISALLAERGFTGPKDVIRGHEPDFLSAFSTESEAELLTDGLGRNFEIMDTNTHFHIRKFSRF